MVRAGQVPKPLVRRAFSLIEATGGQRDRGGPQRRRPARSRVSVLSVLPPLLRTMTQSSARTVPSQQDTGARRGSESSTRSSLALYISKAGGHPPSLRARAGGHRDVRLDAHPAGHGGACSGVSRDTQDEWPGGHRARRAIAIRKQHHARSRRVPRPGRLPACVPERYPDRQGRDDHAWRGSARVQLSRNTAFGHLDRGRVPGRRVHGDSRAGRRADWQPGLPVSHGPDHGREPRVRRPHPPFHRTGHHRQGHHDRGRRLDWVRGGDHRRHDDRQGSRRGRCVTRHAQCATAHGGRGRARRVPSTGGSGARVRSDPTYSHQA